MRSRILQFLFAFMLVSEKAGAVEQVAYTWQGVVTSFYEDGFSEYHRQPENWEVPITVIPLPIYPGTPAHGAISFPRREGVETNPFFTMSVAGTEWIEPANKLKIITTTSGLISAIGYPPLTPWGTFLDSVDDNGIYMRLWNIRNEI